MPKRVNIVSHVVIEEPVISLIDFCASALRDFDLKTVEKTIKAIKNQGLIKKYQQHVEQHVEDINFWTLGTAVFNKLSGTE